MPKLQIFRMIFGSVTGWLSAVTALSVASSVAGGYSVREAGIRKKIPEEYRAYTNGVVLTPTDADIKAAIALGAGAKENSTLQYAYLTKAPRGFFQNDDIYVHVGTPLFLIADHAREQAREFRKVDEAFVKFARELKGARISINQQGINTATWMFMSQQREVLLLRDGERIEALKEIAPWEGKNPYADKPDKRVAQAMSQTSKIAAQYARASVAGMNKEQVLRTYQAMGLSEEQTVAYTGIPLEEVRASFGKAEAEARTKSVLPLTEYDAVFPLAEIAKPGKYELVFRQPKTPMPLSAGGDKEVRFPISFEKFK